MPEITPSDAPSPKSVLGTDLANYYVLRVDATGHLQVHVLTSGLPVGAATAAAQALALAQLQLIEDMRDALQSVATDRLIVRGEDQLFSFKGVLAIHKVANLAANDGNIDTVAVPAGEIWVVTTISATDTVTGPTSYVFQNAHDAAFVDLGDDVKAFAGGERGQWSGHTYLDVDDFIRVYYIGGLTGEPCFLDITGYRMTVEV